MQQLHHQTSESLKGTWDSDSRRDLDQDAFGCVDIDLQSASFVDGRIQKGKKALRQQERISQHVECCLVQNSHGPPSLKARSAG